MNKWMKPLQAALLGAKVLGFTDAPWAQIFLPTVYVLVAGAVMGILQIAKDITEETKR